MPKRDYGYYITENGDCYHQERNCASRSDGTKAIWFQDAHEARTAAQDKFGRKVVRCSVCCS